MLQNSTQLDVKDRKILEQLDLNARQSNSQIAKKVKTSKDIVNYRIKKLEKDGIIKGYYSVLNITKLGYVTYKLMLTFQNITSEIEKEITGYFIKSPHVGWVVSCDGYYNLMAIAWVKSAIVFDDFFKDFLNKYSQYVQESDVIVITEIHTCRKAYLFNKKFDDSPDIFYSGEPEFDFDKTDLQIIKILANNSRIPLYEIASKLNLTAEAIAYRIKQLQKKNVIQAFRPIINTSQLGYQYYNILFRLQNFENIKKIFQYFKQQPNIIYFVKYLGSYDIGIDLEVKDDKELRAILKGIKDAFSKDIKSYNSVLIYEEHKLSYLPST